FARLVTCTSLDESMLVAEKSRQTLGSTPVDAEGVRVPVTASVGGAAAHAGAPTHETLVNEDDAALERAKRQGRNCSVAFG
ncbi:diguanylate cyclase, partial [Burkholderia pseudomallei]|uniref:GGDEF domain-containing protein n=1 Tax=Burkholderia pseudomallei TaxID=28450 RepID=UPI000CCE4DB3